MKLGNSIHAHHWNLSTLGVLAFSFSLFSHKLLVIFTSQRHAEKREKSMKKKKMKKGNNLRCSMLLRQIKFYGKHIKSCLIDIYKESIEIFMQKIFSYSKSFPCRLKKPSCPKNYWRDFKFYFNVALVIFLSLMQEVIKSLFCH